MPDKVTLGMSASSSDMPPVAIASAGTDTIDKGDSEILRIAIAGAGTIGSGLITLLTTQSDYLAAQAGKTLVIAAVADPDSSKLTALSALSVPCYDDARAMVREVEADVLVELIGGADGPALQTVELALQRGWHVVTANKAMIAHHADDLCRKARSNHRVLRFEAAVAGGIPIIKTLREGMVASRLTSIRGILNGTCNYILSTMRQSGDDFDVILQQAQKLGYAEADPSFDIDGIDAAHKLAILSSLAWGVKVDFDSVHVEGIRSICFADICWGEELGYRLKHMALAQNDTQDDTQNDAQDDTQNDAKNNRGLTQRVHPCFIPMDDPLAGVEGVFNAVNLRGGAIGSLTLEGPGAGALPTAGAVVADLVDLARGNHVDLPVRKAKAKTIRWDHHRGSYYLRIDAVDRAGVIAEISAILSQRHISVKTIRQMPVSGRRAKEREAREREEGGREEGGRDATVPIIITTHECAEKDLHDALQAITGLQHVGVKPAMIRIEKSLSS